MKVKLTKNGCKIRLSEDETERLWEELGNQIGAEPGAIYAKPRLSIDKHMMHEFFHALCKAKRPVIKPTGGYTNLEFRSLVPKAGGVVTVTSATPAQATPIYGVGSRRGE